MLKKLIDFIKNHPYLYQILTEFKTKYIIWKHKTNSYEVRKKRLAGLYKKYTGNTLNFNSPQRYSEKIQVRKFDFDEKIQSRLSDKYLVRGYVASKIGEEYLIPLLGVWDNYDDIDFDKLPNEFVLKTNNASGTIVIIKDKKNIDHRLLKRKFNFWLKMDYANYIGYEMHYQKIKPKIIAEKLIKVENSLDLQDYKFLCFNGEVKCVWVDTCRFHGHKRTVFDLNWQKVDWKQGAYETEETIACPENFDKMISIAKKLSNGLDHVRVDLYNSAGDIYFGEMTFTNASGYDKYYPDSIDFELGSMWDLVTYKKENSSKKGA